MISKIVVHESFQVDEREARETNTVALRKQVKEGVNGDMSGVGRDCVTGQEERLERRCDLTMTYCLAGSCPKEDKANKSRSIIVEMEEG